MEARTDKLHVDDDVFDAIRTLTRTKAPGLPVVNDANHLVGILSVKDCLRLLTNATYSDFAIGKVADYMSPVTVTVPPELDLFSVAMLFLDTGFTVLAVVDDGELLGRISQCDMLEGILDLQHHLAGQKDHDMEIARLFKSPSGKADIQHLFREAGKEQVVQILTMPHGHKKGRRK